MTGIRRRGSLRGRDGTIVGMPSLSVGTAKARVQIDLSEVRK